ncbi:MAG: hypothetical protein GY941_23180 [Planctomycetes bacterium]|nr:hypothetical protein [Planctomycetota bacterium]
MENSEIFQLGKSVDFEIIAKTSSPMLPSRTIRLGGSGKIIRNATVENIEAERKCGVAIKFHKKLDILLNL